MRPLLLTLLIIVVISAGAFGGDYNLVDEFRVPFAEGVASVDPIVNANGALDGFVYVLSDGKTISIEYLSKNHTQVTTADMIFTKTINCIVGDTLYIYAYSRLDSYYTYYALPDWDQYVPRIHLIKAADGHISSTEIIPDYVVPADAHPTGIWTVDEYDLKFARDEKGHPTAVEYACRITFVTDWGLLGLVWQSESTGLSFPLGADTASFVDEVSEFVHGDFCGNDEIGIGSFRHFHYQWDFRDTWDDPNYGTNASVTVTVKNKSGEVLATQRTSDGRANKLFQGDFVEDAGGCDEIIFSGNSKDLLGLHGTSALGHIACYSFHNGIPKEEWYRQLTPKLNFYFAWGGFITEIRNGLQVAHLNVATGQFDEVHSVPYSGGGRFFTTGPENNELNLVTCHSDTLRLYRFDIATPVDEPGTGPTLPRSFTLDPNYPNPFNGETVISFSLTRPDNVNVRVFNVMGQQVAQLADGPFTSGSHQLVWRPDDNTASGIYFVTLSTGAGSRSVRMQYVK